MIYLQKNFFTEKERLLLENDDFKVSVFKYDSGVEAVRVKNKKGEFIWLPYKGQQIWRASFCERDLTMKSMFDEPSASDDFGAGYGCFMLHCGMTAMGNPAPDDTHPQHGELPSAAYDSAYINVGVNYIECGGLLDYKRAFETHYTASPKIKLYENESVLNISMTIENKRSDPMEYLYLCHVNFRPLEGAKLSYNADLVKIHKDIPENLPPEKANELKNYMEALSENPTLQNIIDGKTQSYEPEIVFTYDYKPDEKGWGQCLQALPDGNTDYVACRLKELPIGIRWIARTDHEDAMGMLLPATAEHLGYNYCKKTGQIKYLAANESITFMVKAGVLEK